MSEEQKDDNPGKTGLRRGNINFDILEPQPIVKIGKVTSDESGEKTHYEVLKSKRGIFFQGRPYKPVSTFTILVWLAVFLFCIFSVAAILIFGRSLFWLTALPFLLAALLWSLIMLALFKARPR